MSASLYARPKNQGINLDDQLKFALRKRYNNKAYMTSYDIPYLQGLADCGVKDADKLIELIKKHDEVEVWESY